MPTNLTEIFWEKINKAYPNFPREAYDKMLIFQEMVDKLKDDGYVLSVMFGILNDKQVDQIIQILEKDLNA
jgi:hypothetical protein